MDAQYFDPFHIQQSKRVNIVRVEKSAQIAKVEAGNVATIIVKGMSRFGRDYLKVGFYTGV